MRDEKIWFIVWMREKRQRNTNFNNQYALKLLPQHLEHKALQTYEEWMEAHWMELCEVEQTWETRVSALKEGVTSYLMAVLNANLEVPEGIYVVDVEGVYLGEPKAKDLVPGVKNTTNLTRRRRRNFI